MLAQVAYTNSRYPWIEAVHKIRGAGHLPIQEDAVKVVFPHKDLAAQRKPRRQTRGRNINDQRHDRRQGSGCENS